MEAKIQNEEIKDLLVEIRDLLRDESATLSANDLLSTSEAVAFTGLSPLVLRRLRKKKELYAIKKGGRYYYRLSDLKAIK